MVVDTLGLVWALAVTPASVRDWDGAREVLLRAELAVPRLRRVFADAAYTAAEFWAVWFARVVIFLVKKLHLEACGEVRLLAICHRNAEPVLAVEAEQVLARWRKVGTGCGIAAKSLQQRFLLARANIHC